MKPGKLDLPVIWRGCDYAAIIFKWKTVNGEPFDLTGWTPRAKSQNIDFHPTVTDPRGGITEIKLTRLETENLRLGVEQWDWVWTYGLNGQTGAIPPILSGSVQIKQPITDPVEA